MYVRVYMCAHMVLYVNSSTAREDPDFCSPQGNTRDRRYFRLLRLQIFKTICSCVVFPFLVYEDVVITWAFTCPALL